MSDTPSGYPKPTDVKPYDSEAPTQLWQSPFRHLSQFPNRRAARRRERLEALLKGQEVTNAGLSSTNLTRTAATQCVSPSPLAEHPLPDVPPPDSLPTGTYTSIRPVSGPRMAVFIAMGVAVGGLAALQLNRALTPDTMEKLPSVSAAVPHVVATTLSTVAVGPSSETPVVDAFATEGCGGEESKSAAVPPLQVDVVPARPTSRANKPVAATRAADEHSSSAIGGEVVAPSINTEPVSQSSCSRYPSVHIPTQLHPRINPLMTSSQVFSERSLAKSNGQSPRR